MMDLKKKEIGINAKKEFLDLVKDLPKVKCANITLGDDWRDPEYNKHCKLPVNYTPEEYDKFLSELDFNYDNGYGGQNLYGTIWMVDGTWCERGEYDGSEWWEYNVCPEIPAELLIKSI